MQSANAGACTALLLIIALAACLTAGCSEEKERFHILVMKMDGSGDIVWKTPVNAAAFDYGTSMTTTPGGGYAVAGTVRKNTGDAALPRIIRLDSGGKVLWDRTLDSSDTYSVAIAAVGDGGFLAAVNRNNYDDGTIVRTDADGTVLWNRSFDIAFTNIAPAGNGSFILAGRRTVLVTENGSTLWDVPVATTTVLAAEGGGFFAARYGPPSAGIDILRLDGNGSVLWDRVAGLDMTGKIESLHANPDGTSEAVSTRNDPAKDRDTVMFIAAEKILLSRDGNITGRQPYPAVGPMTRNADGGYTFLAYAFPGGGSYTTLPHADTAVHVVRAGPDGTIAWDRAYDLGWGTGLQEIVPAGDGGYAALILTGS